jgi:RHS repeat-associated protein
VSYADNRTAFFSYDGVGNRTSLSDWAGSTGWGYDALNRPVGATRGNSSVNYGYDNVGNLTVLTYPNGGQVFYTYDAANRMTSVRDFSNRVTAYAYDSAGRLSTTSYPNGVTSSRTYDNANRLTHVGYLKGGASLTSIDYVYDAAGNRLSTRTNNGALESYNYDELNRLTSVIYPDARSVYYSYDAAGNRTYQYDTRNGFGQNFSYDAANEMLNDEFGWRAYDANGAFVAGARPQNLSWNAQHLLAQMQDPFTTMLALYDGEGRRIRHTSYGVTTDYVVDTVPKISRVLTDTTNGATTYYIYGLELLYTLEASGPHYVHEDTLGSVVLGTDVNGSIEGQYSFDVFGRIRSGSTFHQSQRQFDGEETDISELIFLRARYYDPLTGRFISTDPISGDIMDTQAVNQYGYARNNPARLTDPSGEYFGWDDAAFALAGGVAGVIGQAVSDRVSGQSFNWTNYGSAFVGGAVGGWALEYTGPVLSGALGSASTNFLRQTVTYAQNRAQGRPASVSFGNFVSETSVGALTGFLPGLRIPGLTAGSNSYNAIYEQMATKFEGNMISRGTPATALKMMIGRTLNQGLFPGAVVGSTINTWLPYFYGRW